MFYLHYTSKHIMSSFYVNHKTCLLHQVECKVKIQNTYQPQQVLKHDLLINTLLQDWISNISWLSQRINLKTSGSFHLAWNNTSWTRLTSKATSAIQHCIKQSANRRGWNEHQILHMVTLINRDETRRQRQVSERHLWLPYSRKTQTPVLPTLLFSTNQSSTT